MLEAGLLLPARNRGTLMECVVRYLSLRSLVLRLGFRPCSANGNGWIAELVLLGSAPHTYEAAVQAWLLSPYFYNRSLPLLTNLPTITSGAISQWHGSATMWRSFMVSGSSIRSMATGPGVRMASWPYR